MNYQEHNCFIAQRCVQSVCRRDRKTFFFHAKKSLISTEKFLENNGDNKNYHKPLGTNDSEKKITIRLLNYFSTA